MIQEDDGLSMKRQHLLERNFGTEDLPILQKIEYKVIEALFAKKMIIWNKMYKQF